MSDEDRKKLRTLNKKRPGMEVFQGMVMILINVQEKTDRLLNKTKEFLLETYKPA